MHRLLRLILPLVGACAARSEPTIYVPPPTTTSTATDLDHGRAALRAFSVSLETNEAKIWSIDGAILVGVSPDSLPGRWLFALAEPDGLRPLPDLEYADSNPHSIQDLHGIWPTALWLVTHQSRVGRPGLTRVLRLQRGKWVSAAEFEDNAQILDAWPASAGCLMGVTLGPVPGGPAKRRAIDCPGQAVPSVSLAVPAARRGFPAIAVSRRGDIFSFESPADDPTSFWIEVLSSGAQPPGSMFRLLSSKRTRMIRAHSTMVHSTTLAYCPAVDESEPGSTKQRADFLLYRFDGRAWLEERLPARTSVLRLMADGTLLAVEPSRDAGEDGVVLWARPAGKGWQRHVGPIRGRRDLRGCEPYSVHASSLDDVWALYNCAPTPMAQARWVVVHSGETKAIWNPR